MNFHTKYKNINPFTKKPAYVATSATSARVKLERTANITYVSMPWALSSPGSERHPVFRDQPATPDHALRPRRQLREHLVVAFVSPATPRGRGAKAQELARHVGRSMTLSAHWDLQPKHGMHVHLHVIGEGYVGDVHQPPLWCLAGARKCRATIAFATCRDFENVCLGRMAPSKPEHAELSGAASNASLPVP